jgi:steroid 5-alpha reductase family enzyme
MPIEHVLLTNLLTIAFVVLVLWLVSLLRRDASIIDMFWGLGFVLVAWLSLWNGDNLSPRSLLLTLLVSIWGLRLTAYLTWRNWAKPEDYRYVAMREHHGKRFPMVSLLTVFGLQGILMWIISLPVQVGIVKAEGWHPTVAVGVILCLTGIFFEAVGDYQLARFKVDSVNRGRVMNRGLWRYTRHPNYFGDFLVWWGFYLVAAESDSWWWTIIGPLLMSFLLIRVSGVRLLESSLRSRVDGYDQYVRDTSAFFPFPPKQGFQRD